MQGGSLPSSYQEERRFEQLSADIDSTSGAVRITRILYHGPLTKRRLIRDVETLDKYAREEDYELDEVVSYLMNKGVARKFHGRYELTEVGKGLVDEELGPRFTTYYKLTPAGRRAAVEAFSP